MFYQIVEDNATDYIYKSPVYEKIFKGAKDLKAKDLAVGNINLIFRIYSESNPDRTLILKQALTYCKKYPDFKVPQSRLKIEAEILKIENMYSPGSAPQLFHFDEDMFIILMEDANQHVIMREGLMKQTIYPKFAKQIGEFLARNLFYTSDFYLSSLEKKDMVIKLSNPIMCKTSEEVIFTTPWIEHPNNHWTKPYLDEMVKELHQDEKIRAEVLMMKKAFMNHSEALIHGDLHTGSILINPDDIKVIDAEFGFFGPMGFDIGAVLGNLVLNYASQEYHSKDAKTRTEYRQWLLNTIRQVWVEFENEFRTLFNQKRQTGEWESKYFLDAYLLQVLQDTAGFGACKTIRRLVGLAHVPDMWEIPDDKARAICESMAFNIAKNWIMNRSQVRTIDDLVEMVKEFAVPQPSIK